jgi:predicted nucleotidyltransferase
MKLALENWPVSLATCQDSLIQCLEAMNHVMPVREVFLFGSHARGDAQTDSDVDLCIVAEGAERQSETIARFGEAIWDVWPRPSLTMVPITPQRLAEKKAVGDHFFRTILTEGVLLASEN